MWTATNIKCSEMAKFAFAYKQTSMCYIKLSSWWMSISTYRNWNLYQSQLTFDCGWLFENKDVHVDYNKYLFFPGYNGESLNLLYIVCSWFLSVDQQLLFKMDALPVTKIFFFQIFAITLWNVFITELSRRQERPNATHNTSQSPWLSRGLSGYWWKIEVFTFLRENVMNLYKPIN